MYTVKTFGLLQSNFGHLSCMHATEMTKILNIKYCMVAHIKDDFAVAIWKNSNITGHNWSCVSTMRPLALCVHAMKELYKTSAW